MNVRTTTTFALAALLAGLGCSSAGTPGAQCTRGDDCASGVCSATGACLDGQAGAAGAGGDAGQGGDAGAGDAGAAGAATGMGGATGTGGAAGTGGTGGPQVCSPDGDGVITQTETPMGAGLKATFAFAQGVAVQSAGKPGEGGALTWDYTPALAGDHLALVETRPLAGTWFGPKFAGASYASKLSDAEDLLGVFEITEGALLLRGVVSPADGLTRTELVYSPPAKLLSLPMKVGSAWASQSTVTGLVNGVLSTYTESYQSKVDAQGTVKVPYGSFAALRVNVLLTRTVGLLPTSTRTFLFMSECFGAVAKFVGKANDTGVELTQAAEISRLSP